MQCAQLWLARPFVREPLNPWERPEFHPPILHGKSVRERAMVICRADWAPPGMKHVQDPFLDAPKTEASLVALRQVLSVPDVRVILLRRSVPEQFISMEIALQTRDWWSLGADALPAALAPIRSGTSQAINEEEIQRRLAKLQEATRQLAEICRECGADYIERSYEELFRGSCADAAENVVHALGHFDANARGDLTELRRLLQRDRRFESMQRIYESVAARYPSLRQ